MMDFPLTLAAIFRHAEQVHPRREIVTRRADGSLHRYTYADFAGRVRRLAHGLQRLGVGPADRVATLGWNHYQHLEAYFGIPLAGGVLHTLNLRLHPDEIAFIVNDAADRVVLVDESLLPLWEQVASRTRVARAVVVGATKDVPPGYLEYEAVLGDADALETIADPDERAAAAMCYTTGTTGTAQGRALLAPGPRAAHVCRRLAGRHGRGRARRGVAGRADVSRQRVGAAVRRRHGRREARDAGAAARPGQPRRSLRA